MNEEVTGYHVTPCDSHLSFSIHRKNCQWTCVNMQIRVWSGNHVIATILNNKYIVSH